jgi:Meiotically up-regulated gene 113
MLRAIAERRHAPEFSPRRCANRAKCSSTVAQFRKELNIERHQLVAQKQLERRVAREMKKAQTLQARRATNCRRVYVIGGEGLVKIGIAYDARERLSGMQLGSPIQLRLLKVWSCADAVRSERKLHKRFKEFRQHGEWFALPANVLEDLIQSEEIE